MGVGIEIIAALISVLIGGLLPLSKKFAENFLITSLKSGKINKTQEFVASCLILKLKSRHHINKGLLKL